MGRAGRERATRGRSVPLHVAPPTHAPWCHWYRLSALLAAGRLAAVQDPTAAVHGPPPPPPGQRIPSRENSELLPPPRESQHVPRLLQAPRGGTAKCGPHKGTGGWHDEQGNPQLDKAKYPDLKAAVAYAHRCSSKTFQPVLTALPVSAHDREPCSWYLTWLFCPGSPHSHGLKADWCVLKPGGVVVRPSEHEPF